MVKTQAIPNALKRAEGTLALQDKFLLTIVVERNNVCVP